MMKWSTNHTTSFHEQIEAMIYPGSHFMYEYIAIDFAHTIEKQLI
jgi:hypothetical protein